MYQSVEQHMEEEHAYVETGPQSMRERPRDVRRQRPSFRRDTVSFMPGWEVFAGRPGEQSYHGVVYSAQAKIKTTRERDAQIMQSRPTVLCKRPVASGPKGIRSICPNSDPSKRGPLCGLYFERFEESRSLLRRGDVLARRRYALTDGSTPGLIQRATWRSPRGDARHERRARVLGGTPLGD